ncbi:tetratricopeptide repeat protein [Streptomyces bambusae]|uniref:tetratricopeptide repeat protein n=1 Tax=Streptomyces bambusae TaxID=1550616 RepID=UPI001CFE7637|nr:tetratricopeptide repeat protein [Streptomyces bambusae]MCB5165024.1 tetratricopeptide repeat protein [Streptomyces bambusae]
MDLSEQGRVWVTLSGPGNAGAPSVRAGDGVPLRWSLSAQEAEELRWYLEDYLDSPYGVYEERGARVAAALRGWGEAAFSALVGPGAGREAFRRVRNRASAAGQGLEVVIRSESARLLAQPWELLAEPERPRPLALDGVSFRRVVPGGPPRGVIPVAGGRLRVLMVIARPGGVRDVGYRMVARPLLERLEAVRGQVELVVLRPPSLARLRQVLQQELAAGEPFQVVHFDGHGTFEAPGPSPADGSAPQGMLIFEGERGGRDPVPAGELAQVLSEGRVPVVVLNACRSAAMGAQVEAAVATRLLQAGTGAVVAMAYSVYAVAAAEFTAAFYERLFAGEPVAGAVAAGRLQLGRENLRPSPRGPLPLADWMVPVLYARHDVSFPGLRPVVPPEQPGPPAGSRGEGGSGDGEPASGTDDMWAADGHFVGRDGLLYRLDAAARLGRVVVVHGLAGIGKSQLAKAFGRWCRETGAVDGPECLVWHSFEPGSAPSALEDLVDGIAAALDGPDGFASPDGFDRTARTARTDCARTDPGARLRAVERALETRRVLVVCDNFEALYSMYGGEGGDRAAGVPPPPDASGLWALRDFLQRAAAGRSTVVVTSRADESWLDRDVTGQPRAPRRDDHRILVTGLTTGEASQYADHLLARSPQARERRAHRVFGELMEWLDGHPLSMRLVLRHLDDRPAAALLETLRDTPAGAAGGGLLGTVRPGADGRTRSLAASIAYSFSHLPAADRELLPVLALLHGTASAQALALFSAEPGVPGRFAGRTEDQWNTVLGRAASAGLLTAWGSGIFGIPPALPAYLAEEWCPRGCLRHAEERQAARLALLHAHAALCAWLDGLLSGGGTGTALELIAAQRRTLTSLLDHALGLGMWAEAHIVLQPLHTFWDMRGSAAEARRWTDRALAAVEAVAGAEPDPDSDAGSLWMTLVGAQAARDMETGRLDRAHRLHTRLLHFVRSQSPGRDRQSNLAACHYLLGRIAQERGRLTEAELWYRQAFDLAERLGDPLRAAISGAQLGLLAQMREDADGAEAWYKRAYDVFDAARDRHKVAVVATMLGTLAWQRDDHSGAASWYHRARAHFEALGDPSRLAGVYQQLGALAHVRDDLEDAERSYRQALTIREQLQDRRGTAACYHQLGMVARRLTGPAEAEDWFRKAAAILQGLRDRPRLALTQHMLGVVTHLQGDLDGAQAWLEQSVRIGEDLGDRRGTAEGCLRLGMVARERGDLDEAAARVRRSLDLNGELDNRRGTAKCYEQLGMIAHRRERLTEAAAWLRSALMILEELGVSADKGDVLHVLGAVLHEGGDPDGAEQCHLEALEIFVAEDDRAKSATTSCMLGKVAEDRGDPGRAETWYRRALDLFDALPDGREPALCRQLLGVLLIHGQPDEAASLCRRAFTGFKAFDVPVGTAKSAAALGVLAWQRRRLREATEWAVHCVTSFEEFPHPATVTGSELLAATAGLLGTEAVATVWRSVTGDDLPRVVRAFLEGPR